MNNTTSKSNVDFTEIDSAYDTLLSKYKEYRKVNSFTSEEENRWNVIVKCLQVGKEDKDYWFKILNILKDSLEHKPFLEKTWNTSFLKVINILLSKKEHVLSLLKNITDVSKDNYSERLEEYQENVADNFGNDSNDLKTERTVSLFLTFYNPTAYTPFREREYKNICDWLGEKEKKKGRYFHFLQMLTPLVEKIKKSPDEMLGLGSDLQGPDFKARGLFLAYDMVEKVKNMELEYVEFLKKNYNMIFTGAPGTGKTYLAKEIAASIIGVTVKELKGNEQFGFVQFHPSYDYTDFVEGLRPSDKEGQEFELREGIFKQFCANAQKYEKDDNKKFVFVIDEINRGEISKIFGELFFSVDPGYRGDAGMVKTQYQNMVKVGPFKDGFYVPKNVYIIGTMNDIDRSVESLDFAFRRRFPSIEITYDKTLNSICNKIKEGKSKELVGMVDEASGKLEKLNKK